MCEKGISIVNSPKKVSRQMDLDGVLGGLWIVLKFEGRTSPILERY